MKCIYCGHLETKVIDSRETEDAVRRRRECLKCKKRFTTHERPSSADVIVIKKDKRREPFDREKLLEGIQKACEKRDIAPEMIESMVDSIEAELRNLRAQEVASSLIGKKAMKRLKKIDNVAYLRFASVYREFEDISSFERELKTLKSKR